MPYKLLSTPLTLALIEGLELVGQRRQAIVLADCTVAAVETGGDLCYLPELLRLKAELIIGHSDAPGEAEDLLARSHAMSRSQGARAWELRTAASLAALRSGRER